MSQNATLSPSQQWQIFNEATVELAQARTAEEIVKTTARSLNRLGLHVLGGSLDDTQTRFTIRFVSPAPNTDPAFLPFLHSLSALAGQTLTVPTSDTAHTLIHHKTMTMASIARLAAWLGPAGEAVRQTLAATSAFPMEAVLAPIRVADRVRYVFGLASPTLTADDIPLITAFTNLASTILDKLTLLQHTEAQKKRADTLREVSSIVNSSLDLNTVLSLILEQLAKVIPYDSAAILLERDNFLKLEAGAGFAQDEPVLDIRVPADTNLLYQEMKQTRRPILINNVRADPRYVVWAGASPVRAWIGVPLLWKDRIIGQISVDSFKENAFTEADVELAFVFAQQVAAAIQNATLFDESVRTTRELQALLESARDVTSTLDTEEVIRLTAERVKELMHAQRVTVYLQNGESNTLKAVVDLDDSGEELSLPPGEQIARQAIAARESIIANPAPAPAGEPSGAQVAVPFVVKDRAIGAIAMARPPAAPFRQSDLDLLTRFALQTGIAIENSNLYKQVENRLKRRELLNRLARRLSSKLSLEALALDIMQTAAVISNADAAAVVLVDPSNESRFLQFTHNLPGEPLPTHTGQLPAMAKQAFEKQQVVASNRFGEEAHASPPWLPVDIKGAVAIPLSTGDRPLGVLGLFTFERPFSQSHEVLNTLEAIGRQAGVAIENAMLFQRINEYAMTLEERVRARTEEIRRQQEQTEAILAGAADAIFITAADGTIEYANPAFTALTGYLPEEVIGQNPRLLKSGQTPPATYRDMWRTILDGKVWRGTLKNRRQDGSLYDADLTIAPIFNQEGRIEKFVAIQRDISKLTELDRLKTEFLGTAAHELRGPLTTIRGYTELLLARGDTFSPKESKKFLGYIHEQAVHLATLVSDLLDLSKIESGSAFAITPETINPRSIFQQAVAHWQAQTTIHTIRLVEPETWPSVEVDPARLKQTLNNLLSNAIKYSPQGGEIAVTVTVTPSSLRVSVSDEGIGMTLEEQKHIFEKFWRADASSTAVEGTGLGMVIVKHIIEAHGGKIWVSSRKGEGTTVSFTLPLTTGVATILIIEDESSIVEVEERLLAMEGYHILTAPNGREGLELARQHQPDLIILDLMMEGMSGETVLKKLKADPVTQSIPVVVVSAKSALLNIENAFALGAADFMVKPFNVNEFLGRIKIALSK